MRAWLGSRMSSLQRCRDAALSNRRGIANCGSAAKPGLPALPAKPLPGMDQQGGPDAPHGLDETATCRICGVDGAEATVDNEP